MDILSGLAVSTQGYRKIKALRADLSVPAVFDSEIDRRIEKMVAEDKEKMNGGEKNL